MLARKGLVIVLLISLIIGYFYFIPYLRGHEEEPNITDRLPIGDFIGKVKILDVARETNSFLYYNKLPFRDFLTYEFILAQGKNYGLNVQKPIYFFSNQSGEWGSIITVNDSSKILSGVARLNQNITIVDTLLGEHKVKKIPSENIYMTYGKNWLFIYHGNQLPKRVYHVIYSKKGEINSLWKDFLANKTFKNESFLVYSNATKFKKYGIQKAIFSYDCDSINFNIKSYFKSIDPLNFALKDSGICLPNTTINDKSFSFHFDIDKMRSDAKHPLRLWMIEMSKRINFPVNEFLKAWDGDISFHEGGKQLIKETYIETEYDEEFNSIEVKKEKEVAVPAFAVLLSMNQYQKEFIAKLFAKGIMRKDANRFYVLTSPPLKINQKPNYLMLYSSDKTPKIAYSKQNGGYWNDLKIRYNFNIDSLNQQELMLSVSFSGMSMLRKNKIFF